MTAYNKTSIYVTKYILKVVICIKTLELQVDVYAGDF